MVSDFRSYLTTIKKTITETSPADLKKWMDKKDEFVLVDVREKEEQKNGVIPGAHLIPRSFLEMKIEDLEARRDRKIVLYCAGGARSALSAAALQALGYSNVVSLAGGYGAWQHHGLPIEVRAPLTEAQRARYTRHIILPEVGEAGQIGR